MQFCVLGSGSSGNSSLVRAEGFHLLIDCGFGGRALDRRLAKAGAFWHDVGAVLLTHTHNDHWHENAFEVFCQRGIRLLCHPQHAQALKAQSPAFAELAKAGLVQPYRLGETFCLAERVLCRPLPLKHDGGVTCGFRVEANGCALGYATDLGTWDAALVRALADVDLLALEFNHDEELQKSSVRPQFLKERNLGAHGHLSNVQAARLLAEIARQSQPGRLKHLVLLHLSRQCNRPDLARAAALAVLENASIGLHLAGQNRAGAVLRLDAAGVAGPKRRPRRLLAVSPRQPLLPGWER
ncbi:MAG: MBL fold metallo-hydrolase [Gemmataceae bacterium]|nr:MBL fold metallo-hydrolase [Gemmataceae bacterium]MCI0742962.1 MBL fold metallo-hydrolase [Gemmataceae bacterium]